MLARVFQLDVSRCPAGGGTMKLLEIVLEPSRIRRVLAELPRPPPSTTRPATVAVLARGSQLPLPFP
jgi:hypothetical protein